MGNSLCLPIVESHVCIVHRTWLSTVHHRILPLENLIEFCITALGPAERERERQKVRGSNSGRVKGTDTALAVDLDGNQMTSLHCLRRSNLMKVWSYCALSRVAR